MEFFIEKQDANTYLVYKFQEDDVPDTLSLGMMANNQITGLLPAVFTQMNDQKYVKYNVSSKVALPQYFKRRIGKKQLLELFLNIIDLLLSIEEYMIPVSELCLEMDNVYVNERTGKAELICLPVVNKTVGSVEPVQFFKSIMFEFQPESEEDSSCMVSILGFINHTSAFSMVDFKRLLENQKHSEGRQNKAAGRVPVTNKAADRVPVMSKTESPRAERPIIPQQPVIEKINHRSIPQEAGDLRVLELPEETSEKTDRKKNSRITSLLFGGKKRTDSSEPEYNFAVPGMEMPGGDIISTGQTSSESVTRTDNQQKAAHMDGIKSYGNSGVESNLPQISETQGDFGNTIMCFDEDRTLAQRMLKAKLVRIKTGEQIRIYQDSFVIGRGKESVDYQILGNPSIGRKHVKILFLNDKFYIEDLNSKNHTYINRKIISSGCRVEIKKGDRICLSNEEFVFE